MLRNIINLEQLLNSLQTSNREDFMQKMVESLEVKVVTASNKRIQNQEEDSEGMTKVLKKNIHRRNNLKKHAHLMLPKGVHPKMDMSIIRCPTKLCVLTMINIMMKICMIN